MTLTTPETQSKLLARLRSRIRGDVLTPAESGYRAAIPGWNLNAVQHPAVVVVPRDTDDVRAAVRWAAGAGLGVGVQATGHGTGRPCDGGLLLSTGRLRDLHVDPRRRRARVGAGVRWRDLVEVAAPYGLVGLHGSSTTVGVVGYTLGGGFGWLGRPYGLAAHSVLAAQVVTADGELRAVSADSDPELFWAVPGGLSTLGVVTELEFALALVPSVYGGNLYFPQDRLDDVLTFFADWSRTVPDELTAAVTVRRFPPASSVPESLRGQVRVALRGACTGDLRRGAALIDQARSALGPAILDTFAPLATDRLAGISADPVDPLPARGHHELLTDLSPATVEDLVGLAGADSGWPLVMTEVRQLGGALNGPAGALSPLAHTQARFSLNAVGVSGPTGPTGQDPVRSHLDSLARRMRPHATGDTYLNFLDLDDATSERVRAAFTDADRRQLARLKRRHDPGDIFRFGRPLYSPLHDQGHQS